MNNDKSDKTTKTRTSKKTTHENKEVPGIKFIDDLDELTRSDLNILVKDPAYDFVFKHLNFVNNLPPSKNVPPDNQK